MVSNIEKLTTDEGNRRSMWKGPKRRTQQIRGYTRLNCSVLELHRAWISIRKPLHQWRTFPVNRLISMHQARTISCTPRNQIPKDSEAQYEEFYRYTGGRWVLGEEKELRDRHKIFDVPVLQRLAAESFGARSCSTMTEMLEGSFNKVFRLVMSNGAIHSYCAHTVSEYLARISHYCFRGSDYGICMLLTMIYAG